jgi:hypothetical protein
MYRQVPVIAILMLVQAALEILAGGIFLLAAAFVPEILDQAQKQGGGPGGMPGMPFGIKEFARTLYIIFATAALLAAPLRVVAAIKNFRYRGRGLGIAALFVGGLSIGTCYCAPTSIGVMIYGLIVYFNGDTARAFQLGERGMSAEEVRNAMAHGKPWADEREDRDGWGDK